MNKSQNKMPEEKQDALLAIDHSGGPKQYPVTIGCVRIDDIHEAKSIIDDLRGYLKKKGAPFWNKEEIKWANLRAEERLWLCRRIEKSELKFSGIAILSSYYEELKNKFSEKTGSLPYKLFGLWYSVASEILVGKKEIVDIHVDRFLEDREGKPTKEMDVITDTLESMLRTKGFSVAVGLYHSHSDIGVQLADFIAGIIAERKKLSKLDKRWTLPSNIVLRSNPKIEQKIIRMLTGHTALGMNPVSLINIVFQPLFKTFGFLKKTFALKNPSLKFSMKKIIPFATILIFLLSPLVSAEPWWNSSWNYKKQINITNNNLTQTLEEEFK